MLGRLTSIFGAVIILVGATQICAAENQPGSDRPLDKASVLNLPNDETMIRLGSGSEAKITVSPEHTLVFRRSEGRLIVEQRKGQTAPTTIVDQEAITAPDRSIEVRLVDANFDGVQDILAEAGIGYGGVNVFYNLYLGTETSFERASVKGDLSNPEIDPVLKQIRTSMRSGPNWYLSVYEMDGAQPYHYMTTTAAGDGVEYARFLTSDGDLAQEMITDALADDPNDWKPISLKLPKGALFPLRDEPNNDSETTDALAEDSLVLLRRLSEDKHFTLVEHSKTGVSGWLKTEWLPMPEGLRF